MDGKTINKALDWIVKIAGLPARDLVSRRGNGCRCTVSLAAFYCKDVHFVSVKTDLEGVLLQLPVQRVKEYAHV